MLFSTLFFSGRDWLLPAAGILALSAVFLFWAYQRAAITGGLRFACIFLKLTGILALAACLLEPLRTSQRARPGANSFVVLADNSQGMQIKDQGESTSRGQFLQRLLTSPDARWQATLDENFQVRRYVFDSRLQSTRDYGELVFDGRASAIGTALRAIAERYKGQPLAGVLLLTDGNATDIPDGSPDLSGLPPIYPVVIGSDKPIKDISIHSVKVAQTPFEDAPVSVQADVLCSGYSGENVLAQLVEIAQPAAAEPPAARNPAKEAAPSNPAGTNKTSSGEKVVAEQTQRARRDGEPVPFRFQLRPEKSGILFYRLRVAAKAEWEQFARPETSVEATLANNSRVVVVDRGKGPYRILYVAGRPNWEYKFLNRAVESDDQIELAALIRIAKREPKFDFRGRAGESSNPLFRGFSNQSKDEIERYDQPVLRQLNTRDQTELQGGFPKTPEDLYNFQALILDDLEAEFFTADQMALLQKFVSDRGGGLLMLGGAESFQQGKYARTPVGDMLPVYLDQAGPPSASVSDLRLSLTREGWVQPWARLRDNESDEKSRLNAMAPFQILNPVRGIKPGASVIATVADSRANIYPALVTQRFGRGRTAALVIGDMWRWGFRDKEAHADMDKAWRQMMRWLVADVPQRIDFQAEQKPGDPNQALQLQIRARDKKFQPVDNASVAVTITLAGQTAALAGTSAPPSLHLNTEASLSEAGLYQASYLPRETGGYRAEAVVKDAAGVELGRAQVGWTADPAADEFRSLQPNRALLENIAKKTGGEVISATKLAEFSASLPHRHAPVQETWTSPFWHQPAVFLFALTCLILEWGLRRWRGLA